MTYRIGIIGTGAAPTGTNVPPAPISEIAAPGFSPELIEPRLRTFPMTPYDRGLTALAYLDCALEAEKAGFDAVFINTVGDYGIDEMKSATGMVVVGAGEATMAMCVNTGRRFSIVTIWPPKLNFIQHERVSSCGMQDRCVSIRNVQEDREVEGVEQAAATTANLKDRNESLKERIVDAINAAVSEDGADTIMLGCTCMAPVGPAVAARVNVPVFESMRTGYKTAEALLTLGVRHSDAAFPKPNPENLTAVGTLVAGQGNVDLGGDCEVCVIDPELENSR
ncbi:MAG: aspartate/glutamate racemase family protein [Gammaproteobacteria bacterium]|nr:aspartate/glutamate racemase family protein [Gammaproteobacteria bacterium]